MPRVPFTLFVGKKFDENQYTLLISPAYCPHRTHFELPLQTCTVKAASNIMFHAIDQLKRCDTPNFLSIGYLCLKSRTHELRSIVF